MIGKVNDNIREQLFKAFHDNCIVLIGDACQYLKDKNIVTIDWDEENISANIFTYIDQSSKAMNWKIFVADEARLYNNQILEGNKRSKNVPRIDLKLGSWDNVSRINFYVEAKRLIQNKCFKKGRKSLLDPKQIQKRYVETGIGHYISGYYPSNGCMLGYILEGEISLIVDAVNEIIEKDYSTSEKIHDGFQTTIGIDRYYISNHNEFILEHFFVKF